MEKLKIKMSELGDVAVVSRRMIALLWESDKKILAGSLLAVSAPAVIPFINAYIYKLIIDLIINSTKSHSFDFSYFYILLGARFITLMASNIAFSFQNYMDLVLWTRIPVFLYEKILSKLASLDVDFFENSKFKDTLQRVKESYAWRPLSLYTNLFYTFQSLLQLSIAFIALATLNVAWAGVLILSAIPNLVIQLYYSKTLWGVWHDHSPERKRFWYLSDLIQSKEGIKETKIFQTGPKFIEDIRKMQMNFTKDNMKIGKRKLKYSLFLNVLATCLYLGIEAFVVLLTIAGKITVGGLSYFTFVIWNFESGVFGLFRNIAQVFDHSLYVKDILAVMDMPSKIETIKNPVKPEYDKPPLIEFKNVSFSYPDSTTKILNNLSLVIKPGEKIAFVGENGAGKTTIIKLLARLYDVSEGEILINGTNIKDLDLSSWHRSLGIIFQDFIKYEYKLSENIHFGKIYQPLDPKDMQTAAEFSGTDRIAKRLPKGFDQMLGKTFEEGEELSIGQWQKVALARAYLRGAPLLILDEPTASIDARSEKEIFDKVEKLGEDKTVVIISHRFSTVRNANKIYVIERGKIVEEGSHTTLLKDKGIYAKLFNIQAERYK